MDRRHTFTLTELSRDGKTQSLHIDGKNTLTCHREALNAFLAWDAVHKLPINILSQPSLATAHIDRFQIPATTIHKPGKEKDGLSIEFFSHFHEIQLLKLSGACKQSFKVHRQPSLVAIRELAWLEVVHLLHGRLDPKTGWASWRQVINTFMPEDLIRKFFGKKRLTNRQVCEISGLHSRSLDRQLQRLKKDNDAHA